MDLGTFSPDVDARFCYLIVVLAGMLTAVRKVDDRLGNIPGAWSVLGTHRLFFFFWVTPVALFFVLDHSGAVNDTSPVAALVVAVTYGAILSGSGQAGSGQPQMPSQITGLWTQLLGSVDEISADVQARLQLKTFTYLRSATDEIAADPKKYEQLSALVHRLLADPKELDEALAAYDKTYASDATLATWKKTRELITNLSGVYVSRRLSDDAHLLLRDERLIGWKTFLRYPGKQKGDVWRFFSVLIPAALIVMLVFMSFVDFRGFNDEWLQWRMSKTNATAIDLSRTRESLVERIQKSDAPGEELRKLGRAVRDASMSPARVDATIGVMTDGVRQRSDNAALTSDLIDTLIVSLRTPNVDSRTRVHSALNYLAVRQIDGMQDSKVAAAARDALKDLNDWKPSESDSVTDLAKRIDEWRRFFGSIKK